MSKIIASPSDCSTILIKHLNFHLQQLTDNLSHSCCDKRARPDLSVGNWQASAGGVIFQIINSDSSCQITFHSAAASITLVSASPYDHLEVSNILSISGTAADLMDLIPPISFALIGHEIDNQIFFRPLTS